MTDLTDERRALVDKLAATLQARVLRGEIPSGARLRQEALAEEFGVSRTPVREALRKLQADGLLEVRPNRGAVVRRPSAQELRDAYEVRATLEGLAVRLATNRISHEQLARLDDAQAAFRRSLEQVLERRRADAGLGEEEITLWRQANDHFHLVIHEASGNPVLAASLAYLHRSFPRDMSRLVLSQSTTLLEANVAEHEAIRAAIERRDPATAAQLMEEHVRRAGELVTLRFGEDGAG